MIHVFVFVLGIVNGDIFSDNGFFKITIIVRAFACGAITRFYVVCVISKLSHTN